MIVIEGGRPLAGSVRIRGAKNAALPILAAALLTGEEVWLEDIPPLDDISTMCEVLSHLGARVRWDGRGMVRAASPELTNVEAPFDLVRRMRASFLAMGPLLARRGVARIALPGGCAIGARPIDLHLKGFAALGAEVVAGYGYVEARAAKLAGAEVYLDFPSVGATENIMMAACLADGVTTLSNAAKEPEIVDLANFLNALGAHIRGAGTDVIRIEGVKALGGARHRVIPDRIEAGTYLMAVGAAGGDVVLENVITHHLEPVLAKAREAGLELSVEESGSGADLGERLRVRALGRPEATDIRALPFPGFPTDLQPPWMAMMTVCTGRATVTENVFEDRFRHVEELRRMGARAWVQGRTAEVAGVPRLIGTRVSATDLRAGAALVVAGLAAQGVTEIAYVHHIDRGYAGLEENLRALGAEVTREDLPVPQSALA
ncbi:MAG: UDP-N-acetylglucosamine 1-carboxyvinyltransferase [Chitinophagales bacterium]